MLTHKECHSDRPVRRARRRHLVVGVGLQFKLYAVEGLVFGAGIGAAGGRQRGQSIQRRLPTLGPGPEAEGVSGAPILRRAPRSNHQHLVPRAAARAVAAALPGLPVHLSHDDAHGLRCRSRRSFLNIGRA